MDAIASLKQTLSLSKVASHLNLHIRPHGRQKCPFCGSSTGFRIRDDVYYNCFACGVYGTVIDLPIHANIVSTVKEAVHYLAANFDIEFTSPHNATLLDKAYLTYQQSVDQDAVVQFLTSRGLSAKFSQYAVYTGKDQDLLQRAGFKVEDLVKYGLAKDRRELFTDRVLFQIKDWRLHTQYLQGRAIDPNCELRWLSTTRPYQSIDRQLFKVSVPDTDTLYLAEGITDTLTLLECDLPAVGTLGVNLHLTHHAPFISKYRQVYVCLDNDRHAIGTRYSNQYKSWRAILPALLNLAAACPHTTFICSTPPSLPGLKDVNDWYQKEPDLPSAIAKRSLELPEFVLRAFCNRQCDDLQPDIFRYFYSTKPEYLPKLEQKIKAQGDTWLDYTFRML